MINSNILIIFDQIQWQFRTILMKSLLDQNKVIARGLLMSKNPDMMVGNQELGPHFWEIHVEVPVLSEEPLVRPYANYRTIGDVVGKAVAWPQFLVSNYTHRLFLRLY